MQKLYPRLILHAIGIHYSLVFFRVFCFSFKVTTSRRMPDKIFKGLLKSCLDETEDSNNMLNYYGFQDLIHHIHCFGYIFCYQNKKMNKNSTKRLYIQYGLLLQKNLYSHILLFMFIIVFQEYKHFCLQFNKLFNWSACGFILSITNFSKVPLYFELLINYWNQTSLYCW